MTVLKGKHLAVLGESSVGKTHLIHFLKEGRIPVKIKPTQWRVKVPHMFINLKDLQLYLKQGWDVSGRKQHYPDWQDLVDGADYVLYLIRSDRIREGDDDIKAIDHKRRALNDLELIGEWLAKRPKHRPRLVIVGTHFDLCPEYARMTEENKAELIDNFRRLTIVPRLVAHGGGDRHAKFALGSMKTDDDTADLVNDIFRSIVP